MYLPKIEKKCVQALKGVNFPMIFTFRSEDLARTREADSIEDEIKNARIAKIN